MPNIRDGCRLFFDEHSEDVFLRADIYEDAANAIKILKDAGHKILIVTYQKSLDNKIHTLQFLEKFNIQYDSFFFTKEKCLIGGDYLVDDNPEFLLKDRAIPICINRPYNVNVDIGNVARFDSLIDFAKYIIKK